MASVRGFNGRGPGAGGGRPQRRSVFRVIGYALLVGESVVILIPSVYGTLTPKLFGIPFFYWFQLLWIIVGMVVTGIAYLLLEGDDGAEIVEPGEPRRFE